jgi:hypothetical protein
MRKTLACFLVLLLVSVAHAQPDLHDRPDDLWRAGPFISPFHAVRWNDATPQVQVNDAWYELISLNDLPADQILAWCRELDDKGWQKRFEEDLPEVLIREGHDPGTSVKLDLKKLDTGEEKVLEKVEMTADNRRATMQAKLGPAATQPANGIQNGYPRLSPFTAVRWREQTPEVQVNGTWYELLAINDVPADKVLEFSVTLGADTAQKHFEEDLIELLSRMDHKPGATATLKLKDLTSGKEQVLKDVPMTFENRQALWKARAEKETQ